MLVEAAGGGRDALERALVADGFRVQVAASGEEARGALSKTKESPAAVVLDLEVDGLGGINFLEWLRLHQRFDLTPVVLLLAAERDVKSPGRDRSALAGAAKPCVILHKPASTDAIRKAIEAPLPEERHRVLVVDDDQTLGDSTAELLELEGFDCLVARGGKEAIQLLEREDVSFVLLDRNMPGLDGMDVFLWIRQQRRLRGLPVVFLSGDKPPGNSQQLNHDLAYWLRKPVAPKDLVPLIRQHLARKG